MGRWHFVAFIALQLNYCEFVQNASNEVNIVTNCTIYDLRNINEQYKKNASSPPVSFEFFYCNLFKLPDAFFVNVSHSQLLEFRHTNLFSINPSAFSGLNQLEVLRIIDNWNLTQLQLWTAHNLEKLYTLDLHDNGIRKLEDNALRRYPNLHYLDLHGNAIVDIPIGFFDSSFGIETLNLAANSLQRIETYTFKALLRLTELNLADNRIYYIDSYTFTTTTRLKMLQLNGNHIKAINSMVFFNLAQMIYLNLSGNALQADALEQDAFKQNIKLKILDLSHNMMTIISSNALKGLNSLQVRKFQIIFLF